MKKRLLAIVLMFLLVGPFFVIAEEETSENSCTGFWGSLSCFFFGNPENRAGKGWFERRAVVGKTAFEGSINGWECTEGFCTCQLAVCYGESRDNPYYRDEIRNLDDFDPGQSLSPEYTPPVPPPTIEENAPAPRRETSYTYTGRVDASNNPVVEDEEGYFYFTNTNGDIGSRVSPNPGLPPPQLPYAPNGRFPDRTTFTVGTQLAAQPTAPSYTYTGRIDTSGNPVVQDSDGNVFLTTRGGYVGERTSLDADLDGDPRFVRDSPFVVGVPVVTSPAAAAPAEAPPAAPTAPPAAPSPTVPPLLLAPLPVPKGDKTIKDNDANLQQALAILEASGSNDDEKIKSFQAKFGLEVDGIAGHDTITELNRQLQEHAGLRIGSPLVRRYYDQIDWSNVNAETNNYPFKEGKGSLEISITGRGTRVTVDDKSTGESIDPSLSGVFLVVGGQQVASQTQQQRTNGHVTIAGENFFVGQNKDINRLIGRDTEFDYFENEEAEKENRPSGRITSEGTTLTRTDYDDESQIIIDAAHGTILNREGDYSRKGEDDCKNDNGCFIPSGGSVTDTAGRLRYYVDYDDCKADGTECKEEYFGADGRELTMSGGSLVPVEGTLQSAQTVLESIYAITSSVQDYPALSRLFGLPTNFIYDSDKQFARLLGSNWFPSAICEDDHDLEPAGTAFYRTPSGDRQAAARIEMERSAGKSPILCQQDSDPETEEEWFCNTDQVCVEENLCYADADQDGEPDDEVPMEGYFYKITWGAAAPRDEHLTPFLDENGIAVSLNIWVDRSANGMVDADAVYMYTRGGNIYGPIELRNGASDQDVIVHYSPQRYEYEEACIRWDKRPKTADRYHGESDVEDVCFPADVSSVGEINFERAGREARSVTVSGGEVTRNTGW